MTENYIAPQNDRELYSSSVWQRIIEILGVTENCRDPQFYRIALNLGPNQRNEKKNFKVRLIMATNERTLKKKTYNQILHSLFSINIFLLENFQFPISSNVLSTILLIVHVCSFVRFLK